MPSPSCQKIAQNKQKQSGNALVIILILIALLAALTAVAMRSSGRTSSNMDTEAARIQGEKLIRTGQSLQAAVNKLLTANKCSENQLSFQNTETTSNYTNASAPTDGHCEVFGMNGAGLSYIAPDSASLDTTKSALTEYGDWTFRSSQCVLGVGSDDDSTCTDQEIALIAIVPHISLQVCLQINNLSNITNPSGAPPIEDIDDSATVFTGVFTAIASPEIGDNPGGTGLVSHAAGCFQDSGGSWRGSYIFYQVLYGR